MTNEEAIKELKEYRALYESDTVEAGDGTPEGDLMLEIDMAVEALEKQIPNKQHLRVTIFDGNGNIIYDIWICPCCGKKYVIDYDDYKYCPWCGQALDWDDYK